jgi:hypothetical protein
MTIQQLLECIFYAWIIWNAIGFIRAVTNKDMQQYKMITPPSEQEKYIECRVEHHGDQVYLWTLNPEAFLIQGKSIDAIQEALLKIMPDTTLVITESDRELDGLNPV